MPAETDEAGAPLEGRVRLRRPYLSIAVVVAIAVALVGVGYLGPHVTPPITPAPGPTLAAQVPPPALPTATPAPARSAAPVIGLNDLTGLTHLEPPAGQVKASRIPEPFTSFAPAILGLRLFYVAGGHRIDSIEIGSNAAAQTLATVPACQAINQVVAAGHEIAYVVTTPVGLPLDAAGCGTSPGLAWSVWLLDLSGGTPREVASGLRQALWVDQYKSPIHLALADSAFAFDRPSASTAATAGETIEVHSLDGRLLWTSPTVAPVADVMLGGGQLAFLTDGAPQGEARLYLWTSTAARPSPIRVAQPASSASLASDGSYLTWDLAQSDGSAGAAPRSQVAVDSLSSGQVGFLDTPTGADAPQPLRPAVSGTSRGPLVAWFATAYGGTVYPAFRYAGSSAGGAVLSTYQGPTWLAVEGGTLVWVAESADASYTVAFAVDLNSVAVVDGGRLQVALATSPAAGAPG